MTDKKQSTTSKLFNILVKRPVDAFHDVLSSVWYVKHWCYIAIFGCTIVFCALLVHRYHSTPETTEIVVANRVFGGVEEKEIISIPTKNEIAEEVAYQYEEIVADLDSASDEELGEFLMSCQSLIHEELIGIPSKKPVKAIFAKKFMASNLHKQRIENRIAAFRSQVESDLDRQLVNINTNFVFRTGRGEMQGYCTIGKDRTILKISIINK